VGRNVGTQKTADEVNCDLKRPPKKSKRERHWLQDRKKGVTTDLGGRTKRTEEKKKGITNSLKKSGNSIVGGGGGVQRGER